MWRKYKRVYMLDLFGGAGGVATAVRRRGWPAYLVDGTLGQDATSSKFWNILRRDIKQGRCVGAMMAPPCATVSQALRSPVRSAEYIYGLPDLPEHSQAKVDNANKCYRLCARIARALQKAGRPWIIENPHAGLLWRIPEIAALYSFPNFKFAVLDQCQFGTPWRKRTRLLMGNVCSDDAYSLERMCRGHRGGICSRTGNCHVRLSGKDEHGRTRTAVAATYPKDLCAHLAQVLITNARPGPY